MLEEHDGEAGKTKEKAVALSELTTGQIYNNISDFLLVFC